jgi:hypothetical protein
MSEFVNDEHSRYAEWDAAYVFGSLSPAERHEFETHLAGCARCASAVAELAAMPGLLGALPNADALALLEAEAAGVAASAAPDRPPTDILAGLTARVRARRRRGRVITFGVAGLIAAAAVVGLVLPTALAGPAPVTTSATLQQVVPSPVTASVTLTSVKWGTKVDMTCVYRAGTNAAPGTTYPPTGRYALYATDSSGNTHRLSSWQAGPGTTVHTSGSTDLRVADIARIELRSVDGGTLLLSARIG